MQGGSNSAAGVREGDVLAGKYRVERVLGIGGMGVVVAAHHLQLDEKVALKFLLPEALGNAEAVARFAREARAAVKIKSEHVARVSDVGQLENGAPYMVMEYLEGGDLDAWLKERGPLPIEQAVEFVLQASEAIAEAHALGIVHRDLKPANLFCIRRADGLLSIKVLDFGISKMADTSRSAPASFTRTSSTMGSPLYMSPEQMRSTKDVDAQTDIWALGMILFELMVGRSAFVADSVMELAVKITTDPTPSIRSFRPDVPEALEAIVFRCLNKERRQRYPNVAELALALLPFAPKRAKSSVERISRVIQAAGLSASALAMPVSPVSQGADTRVSAGTLPPVGQTIAGTGRGKARGKVAAAVIGLASVLTITAVATVAVRHWRKAPEVQTGAPPLAATAQDPPAATPPPSVAPPPPPIVDAPAVATAIAAAATVPSTPATAATVHSTAETRVQVKPVGAKPIVAVTAAVKPIATVAPPAAPKQATPSVSSNVDPFSRLRPK
jgi:serine/threonine protein kinase